MKCAKIIKDFPTERLLHMANFAFDWAKTVPRHLALVVLMRPFPWRGIPMVIVQFGDAPFRKRAIGKV